MPKLRELRLEKGKQQKEIAEAIGTDVSMISRFENYKCLPIPATMKSLTEELGCCVDDIYDRDEIYYLECKSTLKKGKPKNYNLSVRLPREAKEFFKKALKVCGFKDITGWIMWCYERLQAQYEKKQKKDFTSAGKQKSEAITIEG